MFRKYPKIENFLKLAKRIECRYVKTKNISSYISNDKKMFRIMREVIGDKQFDTMVKDLYDDIINFMVDYCNDNCDTIVMTRKILLKEINDSKIKFSNINSLFDKTLSTFSFDTLMRNFFDLFLCWALTEQGSTYWCQIYTSYYDSYKIYLKQLSN